MKLSFPTFVISLLVGASVEAASKAPITDTMLKAVGDKRRSEQDFWKAMHGDNKLMHAKKAKHEQAKKRKLFHQLEAASRKLEDASRQLADQNQNNGDSEYSFDNYEWMNPVFQQMIEDGVFDMTARAFKYSGCAAIKSYDYDRAGETGNPMVVDTYAVFRLCPEETCNKYSLTGCGKNYGEYVVDLKTYLGFMLEFYDDRYGAYCDYCYPCDYDYQVTKHQALGTCYDNLDRQQYEQDQQDQAWQAYYEANGGDMSGYNAQYNGQYGGGNRKLDQSGSSSGTDYSYFMNGSSGSSSSGSSNYNVNNQASSSSSSEASSSNGNANSNNGWWNGNQNGNQNYQQQQAGQSGYYNENGEWVNNCADGSANCYMSKYMQCSDGALCDYCEYQIDQQYLECDSYICNDYYTYCSDFYENMGDDDEEFNLNDFLECSEYVNDYGQRYYIGPHCGSDHFTISLGVFSDENCLDYVGETISLAKVLGYNTQGTGPYGTDESTFFHLPHECVSCDGMETYEEQQNQQDGSGAYGAYVAAPDSDVDGVVAMCAALFERSAQCNVHMTNYGMMAKYMDEMDSEFEQRYCNFIDNIVYGSYDETGEILLKPDTFDLAEWRNPSQYKKLKMPAGQAIGLALSATLVVALSALAFFTHRSLTRQSTPWRPKRASGVGMDEETPQRASGANAAPLI
eukprot:CAMPEP_0113496608 /NCGR_PEP_ID=MMETSP0014_2-20120614/30209_1 /TAXON_ID=2857 /ORGANISM="Nitzschia sp." /LENGTH=681 /DNA_ID=CAMNT_0000390535 /DNA_START=234 /DNA_END=2279 /DNA_ORIENTATION=+ /assembly_acc=CAM_ASM_000159